MACATISGALLKASAGEVIEVAAGTYTAAGTEVVLLDRNITLSGGWDATFAAQNGVSALDGQSERRGISVNAGVTATVMRFQIQHGAGEEGGSGILNGGGSLTLSDCVIRGNSATGDPGGGILNQGGTLVINRSTVMENVAAFGAGIYVAAGSVTVIDSTVGNNTSAASGGGIYTGALGTLIVSNSTLSSNVAGTGGGIYQGGGDGTVILNNSTVSNNTAGEGGGIFADGSGNSAVTLRNSIVANNAAANNPDCLSSVNSPIHSAGYNLIGNPSGCLSTATVTDKTHIDPLLGPLQDNGGPTLTHRLLLNSPALDAGNPVGCRDQQNHLLAADQRGIVRPQSLACDIGAVEIEGMSAYFPSSPGMQWTYLTDDSQVGTVSVLFQNLKINGVKTRTFKESLTGMKMYYSGDQQNLYLHRISVPRIPVPGYGLRHVSLTANPPVLLMRAAADPGHQFSSSGTFRVSVAGVGSIKTLPYTASFMHAGLESVSVPAGNFDTVVKLQGSIQIPGLDGDISETLYLAKGIGIVKEMESFLGQTSVSELQETPVSIHDLAVTEIAAPTTVKLTDAQPAASKTVAVYIQNRSPHQEIISSPVVLENLLHLEVASLGTCAKPVVTLVTDTLQKRFPIAINPKQKLKIRFQVTFDCVNNVDSGSADFKYTATVDHHALDGQADVHPEDDVCPRTVAPPYHIDLYPDQKIKDKGCGAKQADRTFGGDVLTDVVVR